MDDLERGVNWHFIPSYFLDKEFFFRSENRQGGARARTTLPRSKRDQQDRATHLKKDVARIQPYVCSESEKALEGLSAFMVRRFFHENEKSLRLLSLRTGQEPHELTAQLKNQIDSDREALQNFTAAGPATLTQSYARQILLEMSSVPDFFYRSGEDMVGIHVLKVPDEYVVHADLDSMSGLVSRADDERVKKLAEECIRFSVLRPTMTVKREDLASHLGVNSNSTTFRRVWKVYQEIIPRTNGIRLQGPGRPSATGV